LALRYGRGLRDGAELDAREALEDQGVVARGVLEALQHPRRGADGVEVALAGVVDVGVALREDRDDRLREVFEVFDEGDGLLPPHVEGGHGPGEEHGVADGQHRELVPKLQVVFVRGVGPPLALGHRYLGCAGA
jgi:hypothetical protein